MLLTLPIKQRKTHLHRTSQEEMSSENSAVLDYVLRKSRPGDIRSVIDTIDHFGWTKQWLMNIGDEKGKILDDAIRSRRPKTILELGKFHVVLKMNLLTLPKRRAFFCH